MPKSAKQLRLKYLRSIYDFYRSEPEIQLDIRREIKRLTGGKGA